ncbi:PrgI family protein [Patescibacteria group bacterium]|nr:PrgI family protein [Patescibacteria group bacterium]
MRFEVPQFIEREAKIVGPLTLRQFVYLAVPGSVILFLYFLALPFSLFLGGALALGAFGFALAFLKVGGRSLPQVLVNALYFAGGARNYVWERGRTAPAKKTETYGVKTDGMNEIKKPQVVKKSKVADLATKIETKR